MMSSGFETYVRRNYPLTASYLDSRRLIEYDKSIEIVNYLRVSLGLVCEVREDAVLKATERKLKEDAKDT